MGHWYPITLDTDHARELVRQVCKAIGCEHHEDAQLYSFSGSARARKLTCRHCEKKVFIKWFFFDAVPDEEKRVRVDAEYSNAVYMAGNYKVNERFRAPAMIGCLYAPLFALIEEFSEFEPLLNSLSSTCINPTNEGKLYADLHALAKNLADFHDTFASKVQADVCPHFRHNFDVRDPIGKLEEKGSFTGLIDEITKLQASWEESGSLAKARVVNTLVHGGLSAVNVLVSQASRIHLIDLETLHVNSPFVDIGHITAEIKLAFYVYGNRDALASEKYISFFLQRYYFYSQALNLSYRHFSLAQAYYMGLQLFNTAVSEHLDAEIRYWCADTATRIWRLILRDHDYLSPPFVNKKGVFFDFYNTLVTITDDERNMQNYEVARQFLIDNFACESYKLPSAAQLRELYFHEIEKTYRQSSKTIQHPDIDLEQIWKVIFITKDMVSMSELDSVSGKEKLKRFLLEFRQSAITQFFAEPQAFVTLSRLGEHGIKIGIISDAQPTYFEKELEKAGFQKIASKYFLSVTYGVRKPSPELFDRALESMGQSPADVVFVGDDMFRDIYGAKRRGIATVYKPSEHGAAYYDDCIPDEVIKDIGEILSLFGIADSEGAGSR